MPRGIRDPRLDDLLAIVRANPGLPTEEYWEMAREQGFWDKDWNASAVRRAQLQELRNLMTRITDEMGNRLVHSVIFRDEETGEKRRYYVHEAAMDPDEYRAVLEQMRSRIIAACAELVELARRFEERHGVRFPVGDNFRKIAESAELVGDPAPAPGVRRGDNVRSLESA